MDQYDKGSVVHLFWEIRNYSDSLVDPSSQTLKYIDPTSTQTNIASSSISRDGTGSYHYDLPVNIPGMWWVRVETSGTNQGVAEYRFEVRATRFV